MLSVISPTTSVYAGSFITVNCSIQLSTAVDSPVTVATAWRRNGVILTNSANRMVLDAISIGNSSLYLAQVVFSPIQLSSDDGLYSCEVTIESGLNEFIINAGLRSSNNISLRPTGKILLHARTISMHSNPNTYTLYISTQLPH